MAPADLDELPIVTDADALLNFINALGLQGNVPAMRGVPLVLPVAVVANPVAQSIILSGALTPPSFQSAGTLNFAVTAPAANTVLLDTGQLAAGTYDIAAYITGTGFSTATAGKQIALEHRDAANAVTLAVLLGLATAGAAQSNQVQRPITGYVIALDERLRIISPDEVVQSGLGGGLSFQIRT